jgi:transglutaminase-like putative cysteine protease
MEMRARRDLFVVIFLSLFLLLAAFLHSQSMATAALVLVALAGLLAAMLTMQYQRREAPIRQRLVTVGLLLLQALPVAAVLFLLFPRPANTLWGMQTDSRQAQTGLSDSMTPGVIAELGQSTAIAFRVRFDGEPPPTAQLYWRGPVFGAFDGTTWRELAPAAAGRTGAVTATPRIHVRRDAMVGYEIIQEPSPRPWLLALEMPVEVLPPPGLRAWLQADLQLLASAPVDARARYRVSSSLQWQAGLDENAESLRPWLALPAGSNPRTLALATGWRPGRDGNPAAGAPPSRDEATALVERALQMFREQPFRYTLQPPVLGRHSVDDFLFGTRAGFCEHYAGAFVVLMRALGIPARVVTGYQGGERNPVDGWWLVRQADAHAWAEVWLAGRGWIRIDPTAAVDPDRIERGLRLEAGQPAFDIARPLLNTLRFRFDALSNAWNQWLLSYDRGRQVRLLERLGLQADDWRAIAGLLALSLTVVVGAIAVLTLHPRRARDPVERAWDDFCQKLAVTGLARHPSETASAYLSRVERLLEPDSVQDAHRIAALYNRLRYGAAATVPREDVRHLLQCVKQFRA